MQITAVIPAYNEEDRIEKVIRETRDYVDSVLVIDDDSSDKTGKEAEEAGAEVITHNKNEGYLSSLKTGFRKVENEIIVTLDADGEMDPSYIPDLLKPIEEGEADLVMGRRWKVPRISERFLSFLASFRTDVSDTGTGFRALRSELAKKMKLPGYCPCGTFVLEAKKLGARIKEVNIRNREVKKEKKIAWKHFFQFWHIVKALL